MEATTWTRFFDMSSGGGEKLDWTLIVIQMPEEEAIEHFEDHFDRDPQNVTCECCGGDYSIDEYESWGDLVKSGIPGCVVLADGTELTGGALSAWLESAK